MLKKTNQCEFFLLLTHSSISSLDFSLMLVPSWAQRTLKSRRNDSGKKTRKLTVGSTLLSSVIDRSYISLIKRYFALDSLKRKYIMQPIKHT